MSELLSTAEFDESPVLTREGSATTLVAPTDGERLMRFVRYQDETAFAQVVETHAAMVWGVCSQILRHHQDVEDAFQATFLILARKARSIRAADSAGGWICRVAYRTALLAHGRRRRRKEAELADEPASLDDQLAEIERNEQSVRLLEELNALPARYREAIVLCYLEGRTRVAAAEQMGLSSQAVKGLLARGTRQLRTRLVRRGIALSTSIAVVNSALSSAQGAVTPSLVASTVAQGATFALKLPLATSGLKGAATSGAAAYTLAEKGIIAMAISAASKPAVGIMGVCLAVGMLTVAEARPKLSAGKGSMDVVFVAAAADDGTEPGEGEEAFVEQAASENATAGNARIEIGASVVSDARKVVQFQAVPEVREVPVLSSAIPAAPEAAPLVTEFPLGAAGTGGGAAVVGALGSTYSQSIPDAPPAPSAPASPPPQMLYAQAWNRASAASPVTDPPGPSAATLQLEQEYWDLKAQGLRKKAEALKMKATRARAASESGASDISETDAFELEAEADLTLAEVKLCEMNAQRVKETLPATKLGASELKSGAVGEEVKALQHALNARRGKASSALVVDGHFGAQTEHLVRQIQREHHLTPNGVVGPETWKVLGAMQGDSAPGTSPWNQEPRPTYNAAPLVVKGSNPIAAGVVKVQAAEMTVVPRRKLDELAELAEENAKLQKKIEQLERERKSPIK